MSLRNFINDYVVDLGEHRPPTDSKPPTSPPPGPPSLSSLMSNPGIGSAAATTLPVSSVGLDPNLVATFTGKLKAVIDTAPGTPIIATFNNSVESLSEYIPEEANRFRAALKQSQTQGVDLSKLVAAHEANAVLLEDERKRAHEQFERQRTQEIGGREQRLKDISAQIDAKNQEIKDLMDQRDKLAGEITSTKSALDNAEHCFNAALGTFASQVTDAIRKIKLYLNSK